MNVIAEGIETKEQFEFLKQTGCDQAQGFLMARPMNKPAFESWMDKRLDKDSGTAYWLFPEDSYKTVS